MHVCVCVFELKISVAYKSMYGGLFSYTLNITSSVN